MGVDTQKYIRKPLYVDAVRVTAQNFDELVSWCQGEVQTEEVEGTGTTKKFIKVRVHNPKNVRQTKAFIGDWLLYTERGYKVYTNKAFRAAFDLVPTKEGAEEPELPAAAPVIEAVDEHATPQGEPHEYIEATPQTIADAVNEQQTPDPVKEFEETPVAPPTTPEVAPQPEPVSEQPPEDAAAGKYVISEKEQAELGPEGVRDLVSTGEAVLAQDLAESA